MFCFSWTGAVRLRKKAPISGCTETNRPPFIMAVVDFGNVKSDAGLAKLNAHMLEHTFVEAGQPTPADAATFSKMIGAPNATKYPNAARWYKTIASYTTEERSQFSSPCDAPAAAPTTKGKPAAAKPAAKAEESDDDLFGSE